MIIKNSAVLLESGKVENCTIRIKDGLISQIIPETAADDSLEKPGMDSNADEIIDGSGCYLIPGLIDIHLHGACGEDFCTAGREGYAKIRTFEARNGVTTICPTTMTIGEENLKSAVLHFAEEYARSKCSASPNREIITDEKDEDPCMAELAGLYLEGPFLSKEKRGAHDEAFLKAPNPDFLRELMELSGGNVRFCALAPEVKGAEALFSYAEKHNIKLSLAHSNATFEEAVKAFDSGISHVTHFYNAMTTFSHRNPGIVGAVFEKKPAETELIADGIHVHPAAVRLAFEVLGKERIILISDSIEATGMEDGSYLLGGQKVEKCGQKVTVAGTDTIAGSASTLYDILRHVVLDMGIDFSFAVTAATENPAKALGIFDRVGSIREGKTANLVLLRKENLTIKEVVLHGTVIRQKA